MDKNMIIFYILVSVAVVTTIGFTAVLYMNRDMFLYLLMLYLIMFFIYLAIYIGKLDKLEESSKYTKSVVMYLTYYNIFLLSGCMVLAYLFKSRSRY